MGTFEKLGILVIVIIIMMILTVAIYQWGGAGQETPVVGFSGGGEPLTIIRDTEDLEREDLEVAERGGDESAPAPAADEWEGSVPRRYIVQDGDSVWKIVARWKLRPSFGTAVERANASLDMKRLRPGQTLVIPDPANYRSSSRRSQSRGYEVQVGDTLESIAKMHLGSKTRWRRILKANPSLDPRKLQVGQKIRIPLK